jgi:hypothetical protein
MRRESPIKRRNPSGKIAWVARYTGRDGKHHIAKPTWNRGKGTFERKADAQLAIEEGLRDLRQARHSRRVRRNMDRATPSRRTHQCHVRPPSQPRSRR